MAHGEGRRMAVFEIGPPQLVGEGTWFEPHPFFRIETEADRILTPLHVDLKTAEYCMG